jgi:polyphosphate kinase
VELGEQGRIIWKVNNVVDRAIIDALYRASQAGVRIDLVVRAICCLRPEVPGLSDNIRVRSIVSRWLEHSRIYYFGAGGEYFIGSADMMERNLDRRVEAVAPIEAQEMQGRLREILDLDLADDTRAWQLASDGTWHKVPTVAGINAQHVLQELAIARSRRRREPEVLHGTPPG